MEYFLSVSIPAVSTKLTFLPLYTHYTVMGSLVVPGSESATTRSYSINLFTKVDLPILIRPTIDNCIARDRYKLSLDTPGES